MIPTPPKLITKLAGNARTVYKFLFYSYNIILLAAVLADKSAL